MVDQDGQVVAEDIDVAGVKHSIWANDSTTTGGCVPDMLGGSSVDGKQVAERLGPPTTCLLPFKATTCVIEESSLERMLAILHAQSLCKSMENELRERERWREKERERERESCYQ
jgi:hypothetical protein